MCVGIKESFLLCVFQFFEAKIHDQFQELKSGVLICKSLCSSVYISWLSPENLIVLYNWHIFVMHGEMVFSVVSAHRLSWCGNIYWYIVGIPVFIYHGVCRLVTRIRAIKNTKLSEHLDNLDFLFLLNKTLSEKFDSF